jgi:eukaryotic-like serine/threonine-protein kinase
MSSTFDQSTFAATTMDSQAGDAGVASYGYLGRYRLDFMIGHGAMGAVFEAFDATLGRTIAIKTLYTQTDQTSGGFDNATVDAAILQEARAAATLNHPHIVTVYDAGRAPSSMLNRELPYVAMELMQGSDLRMRIAQGPAFAQREAVALVGKLALALDHAHKAGVIHRDIKPANVFMSKTNGPKILDFGLAKFTALAANPTNAASSDVVAGSPQYMSPEMVRSVFDPKVEVDARSDVFSLGVMLYELLCGKVPFTAPTLALLQERITHTPAEAPHKVNAGIPQDLSLIVMQALAKKPDDRYRSAGQFARELRRWGAHSAEHDAEPSPATAPAPLAAANPNPSLTADDPTFPPVKATADGAATQYTGGSRNYTGILVGAVVVALVATAAWLWQGQQVQVLPPMATSAATSKAAASGPTSTRVVPSTSADSLAPANIAAGLPAANTTPANTPLDLSNSPSLPAAAALANAPSATLAAAPVPVPGSTVPPAAALSPGESIAPTTAAASAPSTAADVTTGKLRLALSPWGQVEVDGKNMGVSPPLTQLNLGAGDHVVTVRNADFTPRTFRMKIEAGKTQRLVHKFE